MGLRSETKRIRPSAAGTALLTAVMICAGGLLLGGAADAEADAPAPHPKYADYQPSGGFELVIDGKKVKNIQLFDQYRELGRGAPRYFGSLITRFPGFHQVLIDKMQQKIFKVDLQDIIARDDGGRDLKGACRLTPVGQLAYDPTTGEIRMFRTDPMGGPTRELGVLRPAPAMEGWKDLNAVLAHHPSFGPGMMAYEPKAEPIRALRALHGSYELRIYFGTWCTTCHKFMPRIIRAIQDVMETNKGFSVRFYGLPPRPDFSRDPEVVAHGIKKLPSGVFFKNGRKIGRLEGANWQEAETALYKVLSRAP